MSNHTIKAKRKSDGNIVDINVIDNGDTFEYYDDRYDCIYKYDEFHDLFEIIDQHPIRQEHERGDYDVIETGNDKFSVAYVVPKPDTLEKEGWEEKFDKQFSHCFNIGVTPDDITKKNIKNFITQEIVKAKEEIVEMIEDEPTDFPVRESDEFDEGGRLFKQALLSKLKQ
jgi:hypothetical protein